MATGNWDTGVASDAGDVSAGANITDNAIVRGDGGAKGVQSSAVIIDDSDNVTGVTSLTVDGSSGSTLVVNTDDFVVNSTTGNIGGGLAAPDDKLEIHGARSVGSTGFNIVGKFLDTTDSEGVLLGGDADGAVIGPSVSGSDFKIKVGSGLDVDAIKVNSTGDVYVNNPSATSARDLNISNSASTTSVNMQFTNGSSGTTGADGTLIGIDNAATPNAEIVNFEASELRFKTNNITAGGYDANQNPMSYGNSTNGGAIGLTNVTTGTGSSATFDALRFLDAAGAVITGPLSGFVYISMVDGADVKTIQYRYLNTGDTTTNQVANLADQAQTGTNPWASTAVVADGSGVKIQITTSASRTSVTTICRFVGVRGINA